MVDRRITRADAEALPQNSEHWHFGILYACQEDPRVVVRHRQLIGWSWNQANPWTIPAMLAVGLALLGPAWFLVQNGGRSAPPSPPQR